MAEQRPGAAGAAPTPGAAGDPSMEDILASIRRILSEDEAGTPAVAPAATAPAEPAEPLELTEEMLVRPPVAAPPPLPVPVPVAPPEPSAPPVPEPAAPEPDRSLLAPAVAAAAAASVGSLLRAVAADRASAVHRGGPTIEDVVREELRPLLKDWLDQHLPPLVERLVRAEIERVVGRGLS